MLGEAPLCDQGVLYLLTSAAKISNFIPAELSQRKPYQVLINSWLHFQRNTPLVHCSTGVHLHVQSKTFLLQAPYFGDDRHNHVEATFGVLDFPATGSHPQGP